MKTKTIFLIAALACQICFAYSQEPIRLWTNSVPGALGTSEKDIPTLTPYLPPKEKATGAAIVICPGGGYGMLANHEGEAYARWLNQYGIAGLVLKYRLGSQGYRHPVMLQDAARAVRLTRFMSNQWGIDPGKIGIMGSSAGGHLASTLLTHFDMGNPGALDPVDRLSSRPDFGILCYPVITMGNATHEGSRFNLLGPNPTQELINDLSNEKQVTSNTPPCFIWHTWEDTVVKVENSIEFGRALNNARVPFELHIYEKGPHGMGLGNNHPWTSDLIFWLKQRNIIPSGK